MQKIKIENEKCPQDHECPLVRICPSGAITQNGFAAPKVDQEKCIACGRCVMVCPHEAFSLDV